MPDHFEKKYGKEKFEMVQVEDMEMKGCFDGAVQGMFTVYRSGLH